jgi:hypothetical protein
LVVFILALTTGSAAAFLTGTATAEGKIPLFGRNVMQVAASGGIATIVVVMLFGFRLYANTSACGGGDDEPTNREEQIATRFWTSMYAAEWKAAYEMFPTAVRQQMPFDQFVKTASSFLSQYAGPPAKRHVDTAMKVAGGLVVSTLAEFDATSSVREYLTFNRQNNVWEPWSFNVAPAEWPVANTYSFVSDSAADILAQVMETEPADRAKTVNERFSGKYVGPPGWQVTVQKIGDKVADRTCDVSVQQTTSKTPLTIHKLLDGCGLRHNDRLQIVGRIAGIDDGIHLEAVRFWR